MLVSMYDGGDLPPHFDEDEARQPVVYRTRTGASLPKALWIATDLLQELDNLAATRVEVSTRELYRLQECWASDEEPLGGRWRVEDGADGDRCVWISAAEAALVRSIHAHNHAIAQLVSIYQTTAPATADAQAALAALETARLNAWPTTPGTTPPASYTQAAQWLAEHAGDDGDPEVNAFRYQIEYLIDRPHALNATLHLTERVVEMEVRGARSYAMSEMSLRPGPQPLAGRRPVGSDRCRRVDYRQRWL